MIATQIDIESFVKVINVISRLKAKEALRVSFGVGSMGIERNDELTDELLTEVSISEETFNITVQEILMICYHILKDNKKNLISKLKEKDSDIERKIELVETKVLDEMLRAKYRLNEVYKTSIIDKFDWEVIKKYQSEQRKPHLEDLPVAILRFRIKHPFSDTPPVEKTETFVFETIIEEVDSLINELNKVKDQLKKVSGRMK